MMVNAAYNIIDRIFVSRAVGMLGISAITVITPLFTITLDFGLLIGIGAAVNISIKLGENKKGEAGEILVNTLLLTFIVSICLTVIGLKLRETFLILLGASTSVLPVAKTFVTYFLSGAVSELLSVLLTFALLTMEFRKINRRDKILKSIYT